MNEIQKEHNNSSAVSLFISLLAMAASVMLALILTLAADIAPQERIIVVVASALIVGGIVFSILELHQQGNGKKAQRWTEEIEAFEARIAVERAQAERAIVGPPPATEPYRHHEDHAESPGLDQGQLTSNLSGTTPFF